MPRLPSLNLSKVELNVEPDEDDQSLVDQQSPRIKATLKSRAGQKSARSLTAYTQVRRKALPVRLKTHAHCA